MTSPVGRHRAGPNDTASAVRKHGASATVTTDDDAEPLHAHPGRWILGFAATVLVIGWGVEALAVWLVVTLT